MAEVAQSGSEGAILPKTFDPEFNQKFPGDIILVAIDDKPDLGHHFRFALLAEISTFFSTLPPPSPTDLVDGNTALIPLHGIQSDGLYLLLKATQSIHSPEPFRLPTWNQTGTPEQAMLQAAVAARLYQIPIIYRLLVEGLGRGWAVHDSYLEFAIWAIGGVEDMLPAAAGETLNTSNKGDDITMASPCIVDMCKAHVPLAWLNLLDLHLRYQRGPARFHQLIQETLSRPLLAPPAHVGGCLESRDLLAVRDRIIGARTLVEIQEVRRQGYGVRCSICFGAVKKTV